MDKSLATSIIKAKAKELGFLGVGISQAVRLSDAAKELEKWLNAGYHGKMAYMENHFDKRVDPSKLVPGAKSVISLSYNYFTTQKQRDSSAPKISKYAYGRDYHKVVKSKLKLLFNFINEEIQEVNGRFFVDSAPLLEREWAKQGGLGWTGKNTMIIHPKHGSYFFLAELVLDLELDYDKAINDHCGTCTKCIDACPTSAIDSEGYSMDGSKCISYLTIELKEDIPEEFKGKMENWMFGCDICQEVCPWNKFSQEHNEHDFIASKNLMDLKKRDWNDLTEIEFNELFQGSAVKRTKYQGLKRNIDFLEKS